MEQEETTPGNKNKKASEVEHDSPVSAESAQTKYARDMAHESPVSAESAQTKYARDMAHESPVSAGSAQTKYARDMEHESPVSAESAQTKYARDKPAGGEFDTSRQHLSLALDETLLSFKNSIERNFPDFSNDQKIAIITKMIETFGKELLEKNIKYFKAE